MSVYIFDRSYPLHLPVPSSRFCPGVELPHHQGVRPFRISQKALETTISAALTAKLKKSMPRRFLPLAVKRLSPHALLLATYKRLWS